MEEPEDAPPLPPPGSVEDDDVLAVRAQIRFSVGPRRQPGPAQAAARRQPGHGSWSETSLAPVSRGALLGRKQTGLAGTGLAYLGKSPQKPEQK